MKVNWVAVAAPARIARNEAESVGSCDLAGGMVELGAVVGADGSLVALAVTGRDEPENFHRRSRRGRSDSPWA